MTHLRFRQSGELPWRFPLAAVAVLVVAGWFVWSNYVAQRIGPGTPGLVAPAADARLTDLMSLVWRHTEPDETRLANLQFLICIYDKSTGEGCGWPGAPLTPPAHRRWTVAASAIPSAEVPNSSLTEYTFAIPDAEPLVPPATFHWTVGACWEPRIDACSFALERQFELFQPVNIAADISMRYEGATSEFFVTFLARGDPNADTGPFEYKYTYVPIAVDQFGQRRMDWNDDEFMPNPRFVTNKCEIVPASAAALADAEGIVAGNPAYSVALTFDGSPTHPAGVGIPAGLTNPTVINARPPDVLAAPIGMAACLELDPSNLLAEPDETDNFSFEWDKGL